MMLNRRNILALSGAGLAAGLIPAGRALAADINSLLLVEPMGKPFMTRTAFELLVPKLKQELNCEVTVQTIPGHDGYAALHAILGSKADAPQLWSGAIMATQLAARIYKEEIRLESLTPIVKLSNGFSVTLFTKRGGPLKSWSDIAALKPLKVASLMRAISTSCSRSSASAHSAMPCSVRRQPWRRSQAIRSWPSPRASESLAPRSSIPRSRSAWSRASCRPARIRR